jgi:hypothetical protein
MAQAYSIPPVRERKTAAVVAKHCYTDYSCRIHHYSDSQADYQKSTVEEDSQMSRTKIAAELVHQEHQHQRQHQQQQQRQQAR